MGAPFADDSHMLEVARVAGIGGFVARHPEGYDMMVGGGGGSLSGGQRPAVAVARALVNKSPVLLLDEPSSNMDNQSEAALKRRLKEASRGKTLLLVTHRTSLLELVDRLLVVDNGRVVADGPKDQVVEALRQGRIASAKRAA